MLATDRPYQLSLHVNPQTPLTGPPFCGATLITAYSALTAAQCVLKDKTSTLYERILLVGGSIFWNPAEDPAAQTREFTSKNHVFPNPKFSWDGWKGYGNYSLL